MKSKTILVYSPYIVCTLLALTTKAEGLTANSYLENNNQVFSGDENEYDPYQDDANKIQKETNSQLFNKNSVLKNTINSKWEPKAKAPTAKAKKVISQVLDVVAPQTLPEIDNMFVGDSVMNLLNEPPISLNDEDMEQPIFVSPPIETLLETSYLPKASAIVTSPVEPSLETPKKAVIDSSDYLYDNSEYAIDDIYFEDSIKKDIEIIAKSIVNDYLNNSILTPHLTAFTHEMVCSTQTITKNMTAIRNVTETVTISESKATSSISTTSKATDTPSAIQLRPQIPTELTGFNKSLNKIVKDYNIINTESGVALDTTSKPEALPMDLEALLSSGQRGQASLNTKKNEKTGIFNWVNGAKKIFSSKDKGNKVKKPVSNSYFGKRSSIFEKNEEGEKEYTNNDSALQIYNKYNSMMGAVVAVLTVVLFV